MASDYSTAQYSNLPRGIRNNNPGNIRYDGTTWQGMKGQDGTADNPGFVIFADMSWGTRALGLALTNMMKRGDDTITDLISDWAPAKDNNNVQSYIDSVSGDTGFDPLQILNPDVPTLTLLIRAIANHENGDGPSQQYLSDEDIADGIGKINNMLLSLVQAGMVYAQVDPGMAIVWTGVALIAGFFAVNALFGGKKRRY